MVYRVESNAKIYVFPLLIAAMAISVLSGAAVATAEQDSTINGNGEVIVDNETESTLSAVSAASDTSDGGMVSTSDHDSAGGDTRVAVTVSPNGESFYSEETMRIFVGAYTETYPPTTVDGELLNVTVTRPDETTEAFTVTTDSDGSAYVDYDLSTHGNGTYTVTVDNGDASATIRPQVGPNVERAERDFDTTVVGEETTFDFLVRNGEFSEPGASVNVTVTDPDRNVVKQQQIETDENGFANVSVTPQQQGDYDVTAELVNTDSRTTHQVTAREIVFRTSPFGLEDAIDGEQASYGGYLQDATGQVANTDIVVTITDSNGNVTTNKTTTTDSGGFFSITHTQENVDGSVYVSVRTTDGTSIVNSDHLSVDDTEDDDGDADSDDVEFDVTSRSNDVAPGTNVTFDIEAIDNGSAITGRNVSFFAGLDFNGAPLTSRTVQTDGDGTATVTVETPEGIDGVDISGGAVLSYNETMFTEGVSVDIQRYQISQDPNWGTGVGQEVDFRVEVTNQSDVGIGGIPIQYNALDHGDDVTSSPA
jgi:hypothetical protein